MKRKTRRSCIKKFRFSLEALLRLRKLEENEALAGLARVMRRYNEQNDKREQALLRRETEMKSFTRLYQDTFDLEQIQMYDRYLGRLESEVVAAKAALEEMTPEVEAEKVKVIEKQRRRRVVELLKERHLERYKQELRKDERKKLEEANMLRRARMSAEADVAQNLPGQMLADSEYMDEELDELEQKTDVMAEHLDKLGLSHLKQKER